MINITSYNTAHKTKRRYDGVISIEDPRAKSKLRFHQTPHPPHLILKFEDIDEPDDRFACVHPEHVKAAIDFAKDFVGKRLLVHCQAGVCRSTAMGLAIIAARMEAGFEDEAVEKLLQIAPQAHPNLAVIKASDVVLERDGALVDAWMRADNSDPSHANYRARKFEILRARPNLFSPRPEGGFIPPVEGTVTRHYGKTAVDSRR